MASTHNTPNRNAGGPKAGGPRKAPAKKAAKKAPAKKANAAKATKPGQAARRAEAAPTVTVQVEVRVDNRIVLLQDVDKASVKVGVDGGKVSLSARTADAADEELDPEQTVDPRLAGQLQADEPPTADEVDEMVENAVPNAAVEFHQDPRVQMHIHEGEVVAERAARESGEDTKTKGK